MRKTALALLVGVLSACATTEKFEAILNSYTGRPEAELISGWGPPQSSYQLGDGSKVLQYVNSGTAYIPGNQTITTTTYGHQSFSTVSGMGPMMIAKQCTVRWTVGANGVVSNWSYEGNACKAK